MKYRSAAKEIVGSDVNEYMLGVANAQRNADVDLQAAKEIQLEEPRASHKELDQSS